MTTSKKVYIQPNVFVAFVDRANPKHEQASAYFRYFAQEQYQLYTSSLSIHETYREIAEHISMSVARDFARALTLGNINILYPEESDLRAAVKALVGYGSSDLTLSQAQMAVLANKNNISQICTFDHLHSLFGLVLFYLPI